MTIVHHRMPRELFEALARDEGSVDAVRELTAGQHSKHLILLLGIREAAQATRDRDAIQGYDLLEDVRRQAPDAAAAVVTYPTVGAWALRTLRGNYPHPGTTLGRLSLVAAAAAIKAGLPARIQVPVSDGVVVFPSLGAAEARGVTATVETAPAVVRSSGRRVSVGGDDPNWHGLRPVRAGALNVLFDDLDPFRMPSAVNLASRLSATDMTAWQAMLNDAWPLLDPAVAAEVAAIVHVLVPYATTDSGYVSSSSPESFGAVAMSRQPDRYTCAATLVHEAQHLKLSALLDLVRLTRPDDGRRYYAPWRTDPRPVSGLLQGAYAFFGVSGFWRQQVQAAAEAPIRQKAEAEFARWRTGAAQVISTLLTSGQLTPAGEDFVQAMSMVLDSWLQEPVAAEALVFAQREAADHLARWRADNGAASG
jgi:uncharacterized protein